MNDAHTATPSTPTIRPPITQAIGRERRNRAALFGLRLERHGARRQQRDLPALDHAVDDEGQHGRHQQHHADHRAHLEILLADHLLVGVGRQHVELPADHLGDAEIGDHQREDDETGVDQAVLARRAA